MASSSILLSKEDFEELRGIYNLFVVEVGEQLSPEVRVAMGELNYKAINTPYDNLTPSRQKNLQWKMLEAINATYGNMFATDKKNTKEAFGELAREIQETLTLEEMKKRVPFILTGQEIKNLEAEIVTTANARFGSFFGVLKLTYLRYVNIPRVLNRLEQTEMLFRQATVGTQISFINKFEKRLDDYYADGLYKNQAKVSEQDLYDNIDEMYDYLLQRKVEENGDTRTNG